MRFVFILGWCHDINVLYYRVNRIYVKVNVCQMLRYIFIRGGKGSVRNIFKKQTLAPWETNLFPFK